MDWRHITFSDIPTRLEFEQLTLELLRQGITNSDRMRDTIRQRQKLILSTVTGKWNESASNKYVNEHAWVLEELVMNKIIRRIGPKEYSLLEP